MNQNIQRLSIALLCALFLSFFAACQSLPMPKGSANGYSSANFFPAGATFKSKELEDSPVVNQNIRDAITAQFTKNGLAFGKRGAELEVGYIIIRQNAAVTILNDDHFGPGRNSSGILSLAHERGVVEKNHSYDYDAGAILIDVVDARTQELLYRDFAKNDVIPNLSAAQRSERLNAAVEQALAKFFK